MSEKGAPAWRAPHFLSFLTQKPLNFLHLPQGILPPQVVLGLDLPEVLLHPLHPQVPAGADDQGAALLLQAAEVYKGIVVL